MSRNLEQTLTDYLVADQARFYRLAYSYLKDREEALDAVQTAVCRALERHRELKDPEALRALPLDAARAELRQLRGVGPKVADCVLLYGLGRWDAYPVDVWMGRAHRALFTARVKDPAAYLNRRTGGCAGIAQQYIFAWARGAGLTEKTHKKPAV